MSELPTSEGLKRPWTADEQAVFDALEGGECLETVGRLLGIGYSALYKRRQSDPQLDAAIMAATEQGRKTQAIRIAKSLYQGAEKCGDDSRFTTAAIFALKNLDPAHWRDSHEISGPGGGAIPIQIVMFGTPIEAGADSPDESDPGDAAAGA